MAANPNALNEAIAVLRNVAVNAAYISDAHRNAIFDVLPAAERAESAEAKLHKMEREGAHYGEQIHALNRIAGAKCDELESAKAAIIDAGVRLASQALARELHPETSADAVTSLVNEIDTIRAQLTAANRRAKEHRRQLRQMNHAIQRYRLETESAWVREKIAQAHRDEKAREWDTESWELRGKLAALEKASEELQARWRVAAVENDAMRVQIAELLPARATPTPEGNRAEKEE